MITLSSLPRRVRPIGGLGRWLALALPLAVAAQATTAPAVGVAVTADPGSRQQMPSFQVTGSRIRRLDLEGPSPVISFSREDIFRTGITDVQQFIRKLPQNTLSSTNEAVFGFTPGAAGANLRGLGVEYTLTLVNGRRTSPYPVGSGGTASFSNTQGIPLAAVERIEVLTDGASAIYGSDAVAGVINYVLRKEYSGLEITTGYLNTFETDLATPYVTITGGLARPKGSALVFADWQSRNALFRRDREWSRSSDYSAMGGLNLLTVGGQQSSGYPAYIRAVNSAGVGVGPVVATSVQPYTTEQLLANTIGTSMYTAAATEPNADAAHSPETERYSLGGLFDYKLTDWLTWFTELGYSRVDTINTVHPVGLDSLNEIVTGVGNLIVPASNPYNPLGVSRTDGGVPTDVRVWYRLRDFGNRVAHVTSDSLRMLAGVKGSWLDDWGWQGAATYMSEKATSYDTGHTVRSQLRDVLQGTTPSTALNVFGNFSGAPAASNQEALRAEAAGVRLLDGEYQTWLYDASANGQLKEVWGRRVGFAGGAEFRREKIKQVRDPASANAEFTASGGGNSVFGDRDAASYFAEVSVPVVKQLELQIAGRYEDFSDFGTAFNPKYAASYRPVPWALVRGSFAEGFRAPALVQLFLAQNASFQGSFVDPHRRNPAIPGEAAVYATLRTLNGGNPNLGPEESRSYYGGVVIAPGAGLLKNASISVDWSNTYIYDRIQTPSVAVSMNANDPHVIIRTPATGEDQALNQPGEVIELRLTFQNLAKRITESLDFGVKYRWNTDSVGYFDFEWRASWLYKFVTQSATTIPQIESRGTTGQPEWRWTGSTLWRLRRWKAALTANYVGQTDAFYQAQALAGTLPTRWVDLDSWLTWDIQVSHELPWIRDAELTVGVDNVTNEDPPFYDQLAEGYDARVANPFGAMYYLKLTKKF